MPLHLSSSSSSSSRSILPPLNIMRSLSLCRKAKPTCTLSLASVSAPPPSQGSPDENAMQVDSLQLDVHFVAVPISPPKTLRRTKTKTKTTTTTPPTTLHDINVIPFPTSAQTTNPTTQDSSSPTTPNSYKRPQLQKKEGLEHPVSSSVSPPRKRARKGSLTTSSSSSSRNTPSARARALAQRVPPARPSTPTPDASDEMETQTSCDKCPVEPSSVEVEQQPAVESTQQPQQQDVDKQGHTDLPPYSPSPPPYSPPVVSPTPITSSPTPIPLHVPIPIAPPSDPSPPTSPTSPTSRPLPPSPPPPPPPPPSPSPPPRRPRISPSELKFFIYLYRTLVSGLEARQRSRWDTQPIRRARDGSRREQHLDGVLVEDDDDDTDDAAASAVDKSKELTTSLYEDLEVQDALLALRLRGFLKWNGVDEWLLKIDSSSSPPTSPTSPTSKTLNPFLEDDNNSGSGGEVTKMDVDVQEQEEQEEIPILSSQHLITVLRMRGSYGSRQGPGLGMMRKREQSKLRNCCYRAGEEDS